MKSKAKSDAQVSDEVDGFGHGDDRVGVVGHVNDLASRSETEAVEEGVTKQVCLHLSRSRALLNERKAN